MQTITWQWACLVAAGGAAGALIRGIIATAWATCFPWATMLVNVSGSMLAGWVMAHISEPSSAHAHWRILLVTGFCGGFTTFSTFSWQTLDQFLKGHAMLALANIAGTLLLCLGAVWLGWRLGRL